MKFQPKLLKMAFRRLRDVVENGNFDIFPDLGTNTATTFSQTVLQVQIVSFNADFAVGYSRIKP